MLSGASMCSGGFSGVSDISTNIADFDVSPGAVGLFGLFCSSTDNSGCVVGGVTGSLVGDSLLGGLLMVVSVGGFSLRRRVT